MNQLSAFAYKYECQNAQSSERSVQGCAIFLFICLLILCQKGTLTLILGVFMLILGSLTHICVLIIWDKTYARADFYTFYLSSKCMFSFVLSTSPNLPPPSPRGRRMMGIASAKLRFTQQIPAFGHRDRFLAAKWPPLLRPHASQGISTWFSNSTICLKSEPPQGLLLIQLCWPPLAGWRTGGRRL